MATDTPSGLGVPTGMPTGVATAPAADAPGPLTGRELGGFVLRNVIGRGGYGDVYLADQAALRREAIVKILRPEGQELRVERFLREAQLASRLDHPYAAHIYAFGAEPDNVLWIAMERVRGASLRAVLKAQGPMTLDRFVPLLERICEVVHTAHEQGIVHRDLKPDNVMVISRAGRLMPKLLDFGIARAVDSDPRPDAGANAVDADITGPMATHAAALADATGSGTSTPSGISTPPGIATPSATTTQAGAVLGSPAYMAPEVWIDPHGAGPAADQYALGALAYEALTGRLAFSGRSIAEIARAHGKGKFKPLGDGFPGALEGVLQRALARRHADRYGNVLELAQAFRDAAGTSEGGTDLPQLDEELRVRYLTAAPQPLADAVAGYDAAKNAHQAREALRAIVRTTARWIGVVALACRTRVGSVGSDSERARTLLRELRRQGLAASGWVALARELTLPFAKLPDTHPLPELVTALHGADPFAPVLEGSLTEGLPDASLDAAAQAVARELSPVAAMLRALAVLLDYQLVVPREGRGEAWSGARGGSRKDITLGRPLPDGRPVIVDSNGSPLVALWPLAQVQVAVPGHPPELFVLAGPGRQGARLVSSPHGFERGDDELWDWFRDQVFGGDEPARETAAADAPYRGLAAYTERDAQWYVGREREVEALANRLKLEAFVAVVGPSGVGKSSFVQAGLVPSLVGWKVVKTRPQRAPIDQLAGALEIDDLREVAAMGNDAIRERIRSIAREHAGLLIVIDQFEETLTQGAPAEDRDLFARILLAATKSPDDPVRVVITLRDDFLIRAEQLPGFDRALAGGLQLLGPLSTAALERIIVEPARRAGYEFEDPKLPARMVEAVSGTPAAVALISFTAARLWELRDRHFHQLPKKAYDAIGGVGGALARHADETVDAMPAAERALVRKAFRHLVTFEGTRAVLGRDELVQLLGGGNDATQAVERLLGARLVSSSENDEGIAVIEIVHEALLAAWPRLAEWRREDIEGSRFHEQLRVAAKQWADRGRPRGALWRGDALAEYQLWRKRHPDNLTPGEAAFGAASIASETRGRRIRRALLATAIVVAAVFVVFLVRANRAEQRLLRASTFDQGRLMMLAADKLGALPFLIDAYDRGETGDANKLLIEDALRTTRGRALTLDGHTQKLRVVAYSPDGKTIATSSSDGTARLWDASTGATIDVITLAGPALGLAFSPDGKRLAVGGRDPVIHLWDVEHHREVARLARTGIVISLEFSGDDKTLLATGGDSVDVVPVDGGPVVTVVKGGGADGRFCAGGTRIASWTFKGDIALWNASGGPPIATYAGGFAMAAGAVTADCKLIAVGTQLGDFDLVRADGKLVTHPRAHNKAVFEVSISPDGTEIATAAGDDTRVWDPNGDLGLVLSDARSAYWAARFSPNSDLLATANADGSVRVYRADTGALASELSGHHEPVSGVAFSPEGSHLVTGSWDHHAIVWDLDRARGFDLLPDALVEPSGISHLAFSPDGSRLAILTQARIPAVVKDGAIACKGSVETNTFAWNGDGTQLATRADGDPVAHVWDATTCKLLASLQHDTPVTAIAFARDGRLITGSNNSTVRLWDVARGTVAASFVEPGPITDVGVDPDGGVYAIAFADTATVTIHVTDPAHRRVLTAGKPGLASVSFDRRHHRILAAGIDQYVWIWDDRTGELVRKLEASGPLSGLAISPDGALLVGLGGLAPIVWNTETLDRVGELDGHTESIIAGGFIADRLLVTGGRDGTARVWDMATLRPLEVMENVSEILVRPDRVVLAGSGTRAWIPRFAAPDPAELARFRGLGR